MIQLFYCENGFLQEERFFRAVPQFRDEAISGLARIIRDEIVSPFTDSEAETFFLPVAATLQPFASIRLFWINRRNVTESMV